MTHQSIFNLVLAILLLVGGYILVKSPLRSTRPIAIAPEQLADSSKPFSRHWQDPMECLTRLRRDANGRTVFNTPENIANEFYRDYLFRDYLREGSPQSTGRTLILAVLTQGKPYDDRSEARIRNRVAVYSALAEAGYTARDRENIGCIDVDISSLAEESRTRDGLPVPAGTFDDVPDSLPVPYEWYAATEKMKEVGTAWNRSFTPQYDRVLVLWVVEDMIETLPLKLLDIVFQSVAPPETAVEAAKKAYETATKRVIGPWTSLVYEKMLQERTIGDRGYENDFGVYNSGATFQTDAGIPEDSPDSFSRPIFGEGRKPFIRSLISDDRILMQMLLKELKLRAPFPSGLCGGSREILILSEHDTYYGRNHQEFFRKESLTSDFTIRNYSYLRGIDGATETSPAAPSSTSSDQSVFFGGNLLQRWLYPKRPNLPLGNNQLDYVIRFAARMKTSHPNPFAIGVFGSDTFDKIILMQELRIAFPNALFFTTDLDAAYWDSENGNWTQGLLVAGAYGLSLNEEFQQQTLPFRSGFQTAILQAVLACVSDDPAGNPTANSILHQRSRGRLFEIAWGGPVDLTPEKKPVAQDGPPSLHPVSGRHDFRFRGVIGLIVQTAVLAGLLYLMLVAVGCRPALGKEATDDPRWGDFERRYRHFMRRALFKSALLVSAILGLILFVHFSPARGGQPFLSPAYMGADWPLILAYAVLAMFGYLSVGVSGYRIAQNRREVANLVFQNTAEPPDAWSGEGVWTVTKLLKIGMKELPNFTRTTEPTGDRTLQAEWLRFAHAGRGRIRSLWLLVVISLFSLLPSLFFVKSWKAFRGIYLPSPWGEIPVNISFFLVLTLWFGVILYLIVLACIVVVEADACRRFLQDLSLPERLRIDDSEAYDTANSTHFRLLKVIGIWTRGSFRLLMAPTLMIALLVFFHAMVSGDPGHGTLIRGVACFVLCSMLFFPILVLRRAALKLKGIMSGQLKDRILRLKDKREVSDIEGIGVPQLRWMIEEISRYEDGIYSANLWHPLVPIFLLLTGGSALPFLFSFLAH